MMEQYTSRGKSNESVQDVGLFKIKENLRSKFAIMFNAPILSESSCVVFHAVVYKLLIVFIKFLLYILCNFWNFKF